MSPIRPIAARWRTIATTAVLIAGSLLAAAPPAQAAAAHSEKILFNGGDETFNGITYHSFRIPSLIRTGNDVLIAFVEGRADDNKDFGNINLLYKRSTNDGSSWSSLMEVAGGGSGVWGNPTAVLDRSNNRLWVFMNHQPPEYPTASAWEARQDWVSYSDDDGATFSAPKDISPTTKPRTTPTGAEWKWDAFGPGIGIQTQFSHPGRLVVPAVGRNIYSDDHGATWKVQLLKTSAGAWISGTNENTVAELTDGRLYRNDRSNSGGPERRQVSVGTIEGGFTPYASAPCLLDPLNEASTLRYNTDSPARLAFLNSASTVTRTKMRVRLSEDEGKTYSRSRPLSDAPLPGEGGNYREGGYSSMTKTADYFIGALVEVNENTASNSTSHRSIAFRKFNLLWIQAGVSEPSCSGGI